MTDLTVLYEDKAIIVCIKPAGILSEEGGMPDILRRISGGEIYCVHRLDRAVSGVMVYAKSRSAAAALSAQIARHGMEKRYLAAVQGRPADLNGCMRDLLFHDASRNKSYPVKRMRRGVKEAELEYETLETAAGLSLVRVALKTGRSHQIRVQFASRAMPLAGDVKYGSAYRELSLALWSESLRFEHPVSGKLLFFSSPPPVIAPWDEFEYIRTYAKQL